MVIIGDAAHAASPSSGQGASMAIEDAIVLAQCLRDVPAIDEALATYEGLRRGRVEKIVAQGKRNGTGKTPGPFGRAMRDLVLRIVFSGTRTSDPMAWIHDHRIDWESPVALSHDELKAKLQRRSLRVVLNPQSLGQPTRTHSRLSGRRGMNLQNAAPCWTSMLRPSASYSF